MDFSLFKSDAVDDDTGQADYNAYGDPALLFPGQEYSDIDPVLEQAKVDRDAREARQHKIDDVNGARLNPGNKQARDNGEYMGSAAQDPISQPSQQPYDPSQQQYTPSQQGFVPRQHIDPTLTENYDRDLEGMDLRPLQAFNNSTQTHTPAPPSTAMPPSAPTKKRTRDQTFGNELPNFLESPNHLPQLQSQYITPPETGNKRPCLESNIEQRISPQSPTRGRNKRGREEDTDGGDDIEGRAAKRHYLG